MSNEAANDILNRLLGFDSKKQIIDLWLEITHMRIVMSEMIQYLPESKSTEFQNHFNEAFFKNCIEKSQNIILEKFPDQGLTFGNKNESSK